MKNTLEYKGIKLQLKQSVKYRTFYGKLIIEGSDNDVTFECKSYSRVEMCFKNTVDEYLKLGASNITLHCIDLGAR